MARRKNPIPSVPTPTNPTTMPVDLRDRIRSTELHDLDGDGLDRPIVDHGKRDHD